MGLDVRNMSVYSWNGLGLNSSSTYKARISPAAPLQGTGSVVEVSRGEAAPVYAGKIFGGRVIPLIIEIGSSGTVDQLISYFDIYDAELHSLIVIDAANGNAQYSVQAVTNPQLPPVLDQGGRIMNVSLYVPNPVWTAGTASGSDWNVTGTGQTQGVTVTGAAVVYPTFRVTANSARSGGYSYGKYVLLRNNRAEMYSEEYDLTNGGMDTTGANFQDDGDDLRVFDDATGTEIPRYFSGINTASTKVWIQTQLAPWLGLVLGTAIAGAGTVTEIVFASTDANKAALQKLSYQSYKCVLIDNEAFTYSAIDQPNVKLTGCTRSQKGTSAGAHSSGATVYHVSGGYLMKWGDASATAPQWPTNSFGGTPSLPCIDLAASTNTTVVYNGDFGNLPSYRRPGSWQPMGPGGSNIGEFYASTQGTAIAQWATASVIGLQYLSNGVPYSIPMAVDVSWSLFHCAGFWRLDTATGKKFRVGANWPQPSFVQYNNIPVFTETNAPSTTSTWEALDTHGTLSWIPTYQWVSWRMAQTVQPTYSRAAAELGYVSLLLDPNYVPSRIANNVAVHNQADFRITNQTNGQWMEVHTSLAIGNTLVIDTENLNVYVVEDPSQGVEIILDDPTRVHWLELDPGSNTLVYDETGVVDVDIAIAWNEHIR